jgi:hypothetical protein
MLSDLQKRKLSLAFQLYDIDGDGYIEREDFIGFADEMALAFNVTAAPGAAVQLRSAFTRQWEQTEQLAKSDHNERVGLPEWLHYFDVVVHSPDAIEMFIESYVEGAFALYRVVDPEGPADAQPRERYVIWMTLGTQDAADASENFARLDEDGDGLIPRAELYPLLREWLGNDPNARGNWLLGAY